MFLTFNIYLNKLILIKSHWLRKWLFALYFLVETILSHGVHRISYHLNSCIICISSLTDHVSATNLIDHLNLFAKEMKRRRVLPALWNVQFDSFVVSWSWRSNVELGTVIIFLAQEGTIICVLCTFSAP